jgi:hypothetical protein
MSFIDLFAWFILIFLAVFAIAVFAALGPRLHRQVTQSSPGHGRRGRGMGHAHLRLRSVAAGLDLGLRRCPRAA